MTFTITTDAPGAAELAELYRSVGWTAYTDDPDRLVAAVDGSHLVLVARAEDGELVGLARTISDGQTIAYLQDILVAPDQHRRGVGGALLDEVMRRYAHIRQLVLLTDAEPGQRAFYESRGFVEAHDFRPAELRSFVRIR